MSLSSLTERVGPTLAIDEGGVNWRKAVQCRGFGISKKLLS